MSRTPGTFSERILDNKVRVFSNGENFSIPVNSEQPHTISLGRNFIVPPGNERGLERVMFNTPYSTAGSTRRAFYRWAQKPTQDRHKLILAVFYTLVDAHKRPTYKVMCFSAHDLGAYYRAQNQMVQQFVLADMLSEYPLASV